MSLKEIIFQENNKEYWLKVSRDIIREGKVAQLLELFFAPEYRTSQRASAYVMTIIDIDKNLLLPHLEALLNCLFQTPTKTQKRNILRFLQFVKVPEEHMGQLYSTCCDCLGDLSEAIAVRAFAMKVALDITEIFPDLKPELAALIQFNLEQNPSSGIANRGQKILQKLNSN